jgi:hypothetical protein
MAKSRVVLLSNSGETLTGYHHQKVRLQIAQWILREHQKTGFEKDIRIKSKVICGETNTHINAGRVRHG